MYWILLYFYSNIFILLSVFVLIYKLIYSVGGPSLFQSLPIPCPIGLFWGVFMSCPENTSPWYQGGATTVCQRLLLRMLYVVRELLRCSSFHFFYPKSTSRPPYSHASGEYIHILIVSICILCIYIYTDTHTHTQGYSDSQESIQFDFLILTKQAFLAGFFLHCL
jgi:hypothetical protein